jgi:hypothetical protein
VAVGRLHGEGKGGRMFRDVVAPPLVPRDRVSIGGLSHVFTCAWEGQAASRAPVPMEALVHAVVDAARAVAEWRGRLWSLRKAEWPQSQGAQAPRIIWTKAGSA